MHNHQAWSVTIDSVPELFVHLENEQLPILERSYDIDMNIYVYFQLEKCFFY